MWCTFQGGKERRRPARAVRRCGAAEFARTRLGFEPDAAQIEVLESTAKRGMLNCSRQWGKSTIAAAKAVHRGWSEPGSLVLAASPSERQSGEFVRKARDFVRRLGSRPRGDGDNHLSLLLPNGSRILGLPGIDGTVREFSGANLIIVDEAARVSDALYKSLRPMLAVRNGDLWLLSTPFGKRGFFYEEWAHGGPGWARFSVPATECPRIAAEFLEEERAKLGNAWFRQEYLCEFVDSGASTFDRGLVEGAVSDEAEPLFMS